MNNYQYKLNNTVCRNCSSFCFNGDVYCNICISKPDHTLCSTKKCVYPAISDKCQFCINKDEENLTKVRCRACQRRTIHQGYLCRSRACFAAPTCSCGMDPVWIDFEEHAALMCLGCIYKSDAAPDEIYGRAKYINLLVVDNRNKELTKVLVQRRGLEIKRPGELCSVSGSVDEHDSTTIDAVIREFREEAGVDISNDVSSIWRIGRNMFVLHKYFDLNSLGPSEGFEYEVDTSWGTNGYQWVPLYNIAFRGINKHMLGDLEAYKRCIAYTTQKSTPVKFVNGLCSYYKLSFDNISHAD